MSEPTPANDFRLFVQKIAMQGFYALGIIEIPGAPKQESANLDATRMVIEDLELLKNRTEGNLTEGERLTLEKFLSDLKMAFVQRSEKGSGLQEASKGKKDSED